MPISRRRFLASHGVAAAAALFPGSLLAAVEAATPPLPDLRTWDAVRAQFRLVPDYVHMSGFYIASHPAPVRAAIEGYRDALDANPFLAVERGMFESEAENLPLKVQQDIAPYLGAQPREIALTANTTTSLALVYHGLPLKPGDEVLLTVHDHYVHHESARLAAVRNGASIRKIALFEEAAKASVDGIVSRLREAIRPATRVLGVTWVHSATGIRLPIREVAAMLAELNRARDEDTRVLLVVDGVHGIGAVDETIAQMGGDFFCAGTHKWMFAPRGTGLIWAKAEHWARLRPLIPSFVSLVAYEAWTRDVAPTAPNTADLVSPGGFHAYEHQWAMGAAFRMHRQIGRARVAARIREMNDACKRGLAEIQGVTLHTPRDPALSAGINCFEVAGLSTTEVVKRLLAKKIIASASPYAISYPRLAPGLMNTPDEVEQAVAAVYAIARG